MDETSHLKAASFNTGGEAQRSRIVIVLLIDGLSETMLDSVATPNFARIRTEGVWTHHLVPVFPSISEPNWVSASTGCWPENHGVVSAQFIDPRLGLFNHDVDADWLAGGELLHQVAERQGVRTAALGWFGRYSRSRGALATYVSPERKVPWHTPRVATALSAQAIHRSLTLRDSSSISQTIRVRPS